MAKATGEQLALEALARALADPTPRVLHGSAKKPGIFDGAGKPAKDAAQHCLEHGWLESAGAVGTGKARKEFYKISATGARQVLENSEPAALLKESVGSLNASAKVLNEIQGKVSAILEAMQKQEDMVIQLGQKLKPPDLAKLLDGLKQPSLSPSPGKSPGPDWLPALLTYLEEYQRKNHYGHCPLPELFHRVAESRGLTIGQFHDGLRQLAQQGKVRLHPFTGAAYQLQDEQYALVAGQEIKYYAERLTHL